jgi:hypothetical protein
LRSVQLCEEKLLIGAQTGVMHASANDPSKVTTFAYPNLQSQLGFNSVVCHANMIWASHGEAGIVGWKLDHPDVPATIYPESTARNLQILHDEKILYSIGEQLILRNRESRTALPSQSLSQIIAIIPAAHIIIVHQDGMLVLLDRITHEIVDTRRRPSQICAAAAMPWLGEIRLLLASVDGSIDCVGIDDPLISEYLSPYRGLKKLAAAGDLIAAISPDRQRIVLWHNWDAQRPIGEIHITSKTRHRVADIAFA